MWFPVLVTVLPSTLVGLHLTSTIRPTMAKTTSITRVCSRAILMAAGLSLLLYALASGAMLLLTDQSEVRELRTIVDSGIFSIALVASFVLAHALVRSVAVSLFNAWNPPDSPDPDIE